MPTGAFRVYQDEKDPRDIHFQLADDIETVPKDQAALRDGVDRTLTVLRVIFRDDDRGFRQYFGPLLSLAQFGLVGDTAQPETASQTLEVLKEQITAQEGGRIKNQYMKELGLRAVLLAAPALIIALVIKLWPLSGSVWGNYLLLWVGSMGGVWLSFGVRKKVLKFDDLHILEQDRLEPTVRLLFAGLLSFIVALLFSTKTVVVKLGAIESWQFRESGELAILFGLLLGFSEMALSTKVGSQATELLKFGSK